MTDAPKKYPRPEGLETDALSDARWDLLENGVTTLDPKEDSSKWLYWLRRHMGFAEEELEIRSHTETALIIGLRD